VRQLPTRRQTTIATLTAAGAVAAVALAAGCGGSSSGGLDPVASAAEVTTRQDGAQIVMRGTGTAASGRRIVYTGTGFIDLRNGDVFLAISFTAKRRFQLVERFTGGSIYMTSPSFHGELPGGAHWIKIDLAKVERSAGLGSPSTTTNPAQYLAQLKAAGSVRETGSERVGGVATTRYAASVDLVRAAEAAPGAERAKARRFAEALVGRTGQRTEPVEVWIDAAHRIRRIAVTLALAPPGKSVRRTSFELEYTSFGPTPAVTAPPSSEVFDATQRSERALKNL
jgi:hypothetical protein